MARRHGRPKRTVLPDTPQLPTPVQLPTPLPDDPPSPSPHPPEDIEPLAGVDDSLAVTEDPARLSQLIDFGDPTNFGFAAYTGNVEEEQDTFQGADELELEFDRSPPYREARLLDDDDDVPLPVPPRVYDDGQDLDAHGSVHATGHTRTPTLPRYVRSFRHVIFVDVAQMLRWLHSGALCLISLCSTLFPFHGSACCLAALCPSWTCWPSSDTRATLFHALG